MIYLTLYAKGILGDPSVYFFVRISTFLLIHLVLLFALHWQRCGYGKILENKTTDSGTWKENERAWSNLYIDFNAQSDISRNEKTLKMNYEGIKKNLKKKYAANKFEIYKTGGGEAATVEYTSFELKLISILSINIKGLMCNVDSDTFITNTETEGNAIELQFICNCSFLSVQT